MNKDYFSQRFEIEWRAINQTETFCLHTLKYTKAIAQLLLYSQIFFASFTMCHSCVFTV